MKRAVMAGLVTLVLVAAGLGVMGCAAERSNEPGNTGSDWGQGSLTDSGDESPDPNKVVVVELDEKDDLNKKDDDGNDIKDNDDVKDDDSLTAVTCYDFSSSAVQMDAQEGIVQGAVASNSVLLSDKQQGELLHSDLANVPQRAVPLEDASEKAALINGYSKTVVPGSTVAIATDRKLFNTVATATANIIDKKLLNTVVAVTGSNVKGSVLGANTSVSYVPDNKDIDAALNNNFADAMPMPEAIDDTAFECFSKEKDILSDTANFQVIAYDTGKEMHLYKDIDSKNIKVTIVKPTTDCSEVVLEGGCFIFDAADEVKTADAQPDVAMPVAVSPIDPLKVQPINPFRDLQTTVNDPVKDIQAVVNDRLVVEPIDPVRVQAITKDPVKDIRAIVNDRLVVEPIDPVRVQAITKDPVKDIQAVVKEEPRLPIEVIKPIEDSRPHLPIFDIKPIVKEEPRLPVEVIKPIVKENVKLPVEVIQPIVKEEVNIPVEVIQRPVVVEPTTREQVKDIQVVKEGPKVSLKKGK